LAFTQLVVPRLLKLDSTKQSILTKYEQYKYPSKEIFISKHTEHWRLLRELYEREDTGEIPIPAIPLISSNYPNPFNPSTTIAFSIPETGRVNVSIYNIRGQRVKTLYNEDLERGHHCLVWDGRDEGNRNVASGVNFIRLDAAGKSSIRKAMLLK
jgi:transcription initiation factor IIF auxiliary subunit